MRLPRYPKYKDSGVVLLGDVPAHWGVTRVKFLVRNNGGIQMGPFGGMLLDLSDGDTGFKVYGQENTISGNFSLGRRWISNERFNELINYHLQVGDLVLTRKGSLGNARLIQELPSLGIVDSDTIRIRVEESLIQRQFLVLLLHDVSYVATQITLSKRGAILPGLNSETIANIAVTLPPIAEQTAIAAFLDRETGKIDALISEQEKLLTLLAEKRQATISHAVTKGLNPDAPMKDSGLEWLGEVPKHWGITRLKFVGEVQTGIAKGKDNTGRNTIEVPYLRVANVQDGYLALDDIAKIEIPAEDLPRYRLQPGDVLMNEGGDFDKLGRGHIWHGEIEDCIHQNHVFAVRPSKVGAEWLNTVTGSVYAQFYFMTRSKQSTNLASISSTNIMELPLVLPPEPEQKSVLVFLAAETSKLDALTTDATRAIELLKERRTALISAAVTGKIDVREASAKEAA